MSRLDRARSAIGLPTVYALGQGGRDPALPHPGRQCDCTGFVAWELGTPRRVPSSIGWIETSRIVRDATGDRLLFGRVYNPAPEDLIVYGDWTDATGRRRQGHVGVLSVVPPGRADDPEWWNGLRVIHCSKGNWRRLGDAIAETDAEAFRGRAIFARWLASA